MLTRTTPVDDIVNEFKFGSPGFLSKDAHNWNNVQEAFRALSDEKLASIGHFNPGLQGRGIVIAGGGLKYFPGLWVEIRGIRDLGCDLPIEVWYLGDQEMDDKMIKILSDYNVKCIDAELLLEEYPIRIMGGWELKPYSVKHSSFQEVLFLDADNFPLIKPDYLFDEDDYKAFGSIFWPDYDRWILTEQVWDTFGIRYRKEPAFESGQLLIDKAKCWKELETALFYAEYSDYVFKHVYGDKECFHLAWRKCKTPYAIPPIKPDWQTHTIIQYDFQGRPLFHHRCQDKLKYSGANRWLPGFYRETDRRKYLADLTRKWSGKMWQGKLPTDTEKETICELQNKVYMYRRVGYDERRLILLEDNKIGDGAAAMETRWLVRTVNNQVLLSLCSDDNVTCQLTKCPDGVWRGRWLQFERMPIELLPLHAIAAPEKANTAPLASKNKRIVLIDLESLDGQTLDVSAFNGVVEALHLNKDNEFYALTMCDSIVAEQRLKHLKTRKLKIKYDAIVNNEDMNQEEKARIGIDLFEKVGLDFKKRKCEELKPVLVIANEKPKWYGNTPRISIGKVTNGRRKTTAKKNAVPKRTRKEPARGKVRGQSRRDNSRL